MVANALRVAPSHPQVQGPVTQIRTVLVAALLGDPAEEMDL